MAVVFEKTKMLTDTVFHYCPGCNHGIAHRLVGEAIEELGLEKGQLVLKTGVPEDNTCYETAMELVDDGCDVIFADSIGRTDLWGGSYAALEKSIKEKIFTLPASTVIYPGHGEPTTVAHERQYNPYFGG